MLSLVGLETIDRGGYIVALGPVAVHPDVQRQGVGTRLVQEALELLDATEHGITVVLGDPHYYSRFGFITASEVGIYPPVAWPEEHFMARIRDAGEGRSGMVRYPSPWGVDVDVTKIELRRASLEDMKTVARVFAISFRYALPFLPNLHTAEEDVAFFSEKVFSQDQVWLAVDAQQQVVGFIGFNDSFVNHLYVLPLAHGKGVGKLLLAHAMSERKTLRLWTFQKNQSARAFYSKMGFREIQLTDGEGNEEKEPDVLLEWVRA
jgi:predicted N-acetyltransferase YhbS